jgi:hypothetical protein
VSAGAVLALVAGCTQVIGSVALARPVGVGTAAGSPACAAVDLTSCLMPIPAHGRAWPAQSTPVGILTVQQFVDHYYGTADATQRSSEADRLRLLHVRSIARRNWIAANTEQADLVLLSFTSPAEARSRVLGAELSYSEEPGVTPVALHGLDSGILAYHKPTLDAAGNIRTVAYASFGDVEMEMFFFSPARVDTATLTDWLRQQSALLTH